jgi:SAM-dependent methyltransferase
MDTINATPTELIGDRSAETFHQWGKDVLGWMKQHGGLQPDEAVLEVGCGPGYNAVPLVDYLSDAGSYDAFDPDGAKIAWCQANISMKRSNFRFQAIDLYNKLYNPRGTVVPTEFVFPYPDASFDFVILTSIFTHFTPDEVDHYLGEIARVLKRGGRSYISYFLLNYESLYLRSIGKGRQDLPLRVGLGGALADDLEQLVVVAYDEGFLRPLYAKHGLKPREPFCYGSWCGREVSAVDNQDVIVADRV